MLQIYDASTSKAKIDVVLLEERLDLIKLNHFFLWKVECYR
jgi:hypothetical protein